MLKACAAFAAALLALTFAGEPRPARAAPHDAATCANLKTEMSALEAGGVRADMARGPAAAKSSLPAARLQQIARLIDVEGQLRFRCPLEKPFVVLKDQQPEEGDAQAPVVAPPKKKVTPAKAGPPAKADAAAKPAGKDAARPPAAKQPAATKAAAPATPGQAEAKPAPKPRPKPKADDAYRPPAPAGTPPQSAASKAPAPPKKAEN